MKIEYKEVDYVIGNFFNKKDIEFDESKFDDIDMDKYSEKYSESALWDKIKGTIKSVGIELLYNALQLYYVTKRPDCPPHVKAGIIAALGYFISPLDLIPDMIPVAGFADDGGAILLALAHARTYIDDDIRQQAKNTIKGFLGDDILDELD